MTAKSPDKLAVAVRALKQEAAGLDALLLNLEERLRRLELGIPIWLDVALASQTTFEEEIDPSDEEEVVRATVGWDIGVVAIDEEWRIAAKARYGRRIGEDRFGDPEFEWTDLRVPIPLVDAPRLVKLQAAGFLRLLFDEIVSMVERYTSSILEARQAFSRSRK